ncbi:TRAP type immunogenic protein [Bacillus freudenreichii]|nr:TRAP type immunogenic protein [Bacillus freudenreichii]
MKIQLKKKRKLFLAIISMVAITLAGCGSSSTSGSEKDGYKPEPNSITLASGPIGGGWYQTGSSIAELLMREIPGLNVTVIEGGADTNIRDVANGEAHIGYTFSDTVNDAVNGTGVFEDGTIDNISGVASLYTSYFQAFAIEKGKYNNFEELVDGAHILPGMKNWGGEQLTRKILSYYDTTYEDIEANGGKVSYTTYADMPSLLGDGHADVGMGVTAAPSSMIMEINALKGIKFLEVPDEIMKKIHDENPGFLPAEIPANTYDGQAEAVNTLAAYTVIVANKDLPEELVERITKVILDNEEELIKNNEAMKDFDGEKILDGFQGAPIHPGAEKAVSE